LAQNHTLVFENKDLVPLLFGERNAHISYIEKKLGLTINDRGNELTLSGPPASVLQAERILHALWEKLQHQQDVGIAEIDAELRFFDAGNPPQKTNGHKHMVDEKTVIHTKKKRISPRSPNQARYIEAIMNNPIGEVERLIFCRPAVEAGERLGFLPGDMKEKVDPYLRPIYDALNDMMPWDIIVKKMELGEIEVAPLAFMRGRTLSNAFVILDEAQNTTATQMKMFLTRMGESSRMVITGDLTQTDLPKSEKSGLRDACETLERIEEIKFIRFGKEDVIRHPLVGKIVEAYDRKS
jgi:phosphate starvation-inducible PhoH-like protein